MPTKNAPDVLTALAQRVAPGRVVLSVDDGGYDVEIYNRSGGHAWGAPSLAEAAEVALEDVTNGAVPDGIVPVWRRLGRPQRELVLHTLRARAAQHTAAALKARLGGDGRASTAEFQIADAFNAAASDLDILEVDDEGHLRPLEPIDGDGPVTATRTKPRPQAAAEPSKEIADELRAARERAKLTPLELAKKVHEKVSVIVAAEAGEHAAPPAFVRKVLRACGVPARYTVATSE